MKSLLFIVFSFFVNPIFAQQDNSREGYPKTITVEGSAEMSIVPDELYVQVQFKEYKKKGEDKVEIEKIKADFLAACRSIQIPDSLIKIGSYMGYNQNQFASKRKKKDPDLINSVMYQVKFYNTKKIEELINLLDDEATAMFKIGRSSHTKITEFRKQLKIEAVKAAKQKAIYLTEAIGEKIGDAIAIYDEYNIVMPPETVDEKLKFIEAIDMWIIWREKENGDWDMIHKINFPGVAWRVSWSITGSILAISTEENKVHLYKESLEGKWEEVKQIDDQQL